MSTLRTRNPALRPLRILLWSIRTPAVASVSALDREVFGDHDGDTTAAHHAIRPYERRRHQWPRRPRRRGAEPPPQQLAAALEVSLREHLADALHAVAEQRR